MIRWGEEKGGIRSHICRLDSCLCMQLVALAACGGPYCCSEDARAPSGWFVLEGGENKSRADVASRSIEMGTGPQVGYPRWRRSWKAGLANHGQKEGAAIKMD